ncbi:phosphotransferase [Actinobaculum suis]|uniref:phosphotransferase n=1 Tax=Actinobaculum suis TaxID=1657 RepID=UPI000808697C|nr:phosphotransferase [Actinobaculum suis]OCA93455.1 phosphotransferase [Actinobaculum suis]OCA95259.1 phosphotransferase [Actinobaculum suis]
MAITDGGEAQALALLTSGEAGAMLAVAYAPRAVHSWAVHSVHHRPGAGVTVGYQVVVTAEVGYAAGANSGASMGTAARGLPKVPTGAAVRSGASNNFAGGAGPSAAATATATEEKYVCASTAQLSRPDLPFLKHMTHGGVQVTLWEYPYDPELPALAVACSPRKMSELLGKRVGVELKSYRPTRRAVVRVVDEAGKGAFAKVLKPPAAGSLAKRHHMLTAAGVPAPRVLAENEQGSVLISQLAGEPLANALGRGLLGQARAVLDSLEATLDALPDSVMQLSRRAAWSDRVEHYAHAAATALPQIRSRAEAVAHGVRQILSTVPAGPLQPVHGDFYEANIFLRNIPETTAPASPNTTSTRPQGRIQEGTRGRVQGGRLEAGIIDVDSLGPGYRVDDWACLLGHMSVLPHLAPASYPHIRHDLESFCRMLEYRVSPPALYARCAGVTLSLVAGAARVDGTPWEEDALGRLTEAENWLRRAQSFLGPVDPRQPRKLR